jgi:hypothetical protein
MSQKQIQIVDAIRYNLALARMALIDVQAQRLLAEQAKHKEVAMTILIDSGLEGTPCQIQDDGLVFGADGTPVSDE